MRRDPRPARDEGDLALRKDRVGKGPTRSQDAAPAGMRRTSEQATRTAGVAWRASGWQQVRTTESGQGRSMIASSRESARLVRKAGPRAPEVRGHSPSGRARRTRVGKGAGAGSGRPRMTHAVIRMTGAMRASTPALHRVKAAAGAIAQEAPGAGVDG